MALPDFPIPNIVYFVNKNSFCGSHRGMNYRLTPVKNDEESKIVLSVWYGMLCSSLSEEKLHEEFPLDADGLAQAVEKLKAQFSVFEQQTTGETE